MKTLHSAALLLIILVLVATTSFAQPRDLVWNQVFGGLSIDYLMQVEQTSDGGFIMVGATISFDAELWDVWLIKTDSGGNEQWSTTFGGANYDNGYGVQQTEDGGYIIVAQSGSFSHPGTDVWLIKTDANGIEEWNEVYNHYINDYAYSVQQTNDGGYIVTGYMIMPGDIDWDVFLLKTDSDGNEEWLETFGGDLREWGRSVLQTDDGSFVVSGTTESFSQGFGDVLLLKTDSSGNQLWLSSFGGESNEYGYHVTQTSDEGYAIAAYTGSFGEGWNDAWLIKTDADGNPLWDETYGGTEFDEAYSVQQTSDGGYVLAGFTRPINDGDDDLWLIKTDSGGGESWNQRFGDTGDEYAQYVIQGQDGLYYVCGSTTSYGAGSDDGWLICASEGGQGVSSGDVIIPSVFQIAGIYPNPFNSTMTISIDLPVPSDLKLCVFNTMGQQVAVVANDQYMLGQQRFTFDATGLSTGTYFIQAAVPGQLNQMRKVVYLK